MHDVEAAPDPHSITRFITATFEGVDVVSIPGASFFSVDREKHWPNFATIVTTDEFDMGLVSNLAARPGVFRLNIGVGRETFDRLVGEAFAHADDVDYSVLDRLLPHPVYGRQHWVSILSPSRSTFDDVVRPLLTEAYERLAAQRARRTARRVDTRG